MDRPMPLKETCYEVSKRWEDTVPFRATRNINIDQEAEVWRRNPKLEA